ncbi:MAG: phasin family protein [Gammaproteobacteria bacterium]|nr:phasin family protein [Gammaproteobacteria bacterium]
MLRRTMFARVFTIYPKNFSLLPFSGDSIMAKAIENRQLEAALAPVVAFNKLVLRNAEKAFNMQITSLQAYAKVNLDNINAGLEVRNVDDFKVYAEKQKDVAKEITAQISADVKAFGELNAKFLEDTRTLTESNIKAAAETAKAA